MNFSYRTYSELQRIKRQFMWIWQGIQLSPGLTGYPTATRAARSSRKIVYWNFERPKKPVAFRTLFTQFAPGYHESKQVKSTLSTEFSIKQCLCTYCIYFCRHNAFTNWTVDLNGIWLESQIDYIKKYHRGNIVQFS